MVTSSCERTSSLGLIESLSKMVKKKRKARYDERRSKKQGEIREEKKGLEKGV